jgi:dCTP deaminase
VDFRLGQTFVVFRRTSAPYLDPRQPESAAGATEVVAREPNQPYIIQPQELVLATTLERLGLPADLLGRLEGRSSLGRLGIIVHSTASLFHPGWEGHPTMELGNLGVMPVALYPGMRICAFTFQRLSSPAVRPYGSRPGDKYVGGHDLTSRIWDEREELQP